MTLQIGGCTGARAVLCCAVLCCAVLCCAVLCCAVLCCARPDQAVLRIAMLCCATLRCDRDPLVFAHYHSHQKQRASIQMNTWVEFADGGAACDFHKNPCREGTVCAEYVQGQHPGHCVNATVSYVPSYSTQLACKVMLLLFQVKLFLRCHCISAHGRLVVHQVSRKSFNM